MPSVRVKRGYSNSRDTSTQTSGPSVDEGPNLAGPSGEIYSLSHRHSAYPLTERQPAHPEYARARSLTINVPDSENTVRARPAPPARLHRPPSKVSNHILGGETISPNREQSNERGGEGADDHEAILSETRRSLRSLSLHSHDSSDMVSFEGTQAEILVPAAEDRQPGRIGSSLSLSHLDIVEGPTDEDHHHDDIVEHLDVIDPQVATVSMLANAANSIVIPPLSWYSRKPVIVLHKRRRRLDEGDVEKHGDVHEDALDQHVEDVLRKRDKFRRVMQGIWSFVKTPLGSLVAIYGFLVVFWGAGIVVFLAKMINLHNANTQGFWVEVCQQVETGLFTATSIGLIPFRALDTWRIYKIWYYKRKVIKLRRKAGLPDLYDLDDLPDPVYDVNYVHVLTDEEQADLHYQQHKFMQSQTWYRPHGTQTHRAFPINTALLICILNDLNSFFQCLLSGCMWSMNRFQRPAWTTATTLPAAFIAGIASACYIWWGGKKTKRHAQVEQRLRTALATEFPATSAPLSEKPSTTAVESDEAKSNSPDEPSTTVPSAPMSPGETPGRVYDADSFTCQEQLPSSVSAEKATLKHQGSTASIPISDHMTVPPADLIHHHHVSPIQEVDDSKAPDTG